MHTKKVYKKTYEDLALIDKAQAKYLAKLAPTKKVQVSPLDITNNTKFNSIGRKYVYNQKQLLKHYKEYNILIEELQTECCIFDEGFNLKLVDNQIQFETLEKKKTFQKKNKELNETIIDISLDLYTEDELSIVPAFGTPEFMAEFEILILENLEV